MHFTESLKTVAGSHGTEYLGSPEVIDHLRDMGVFAGVPALMSAYRLAVASQTVSRFLAAGSWGAGSAAQIERFTRHSGLRPELVSFLFQAIGAAAGMDVAPPDAAADLSVSKCAADGTISGSDRECTPDEACEPVAAYAGHASAAGVTDINPRWHRMLGRDERCAFVESIVEIDREREPIVELTLDNVGCVEATENTATLTFELRRTAPRATGMLNYAAYDMSGRITHLGLAAAVDVESGSRTPHQLRLVLNPGRLSKILLYWAQ